MSYPKDIFAKDVDNGKDDVYFNCSAFECFQCFSDLYDHEIGIKSVVHKCTTDKPRICPVDSMNVKLAYGERSPSVDSYMPSTCNFAKVLNSPKSDRIVTIYIFGGSVTHGTTQTTGCCCTLDKKCPATRICNTENYEWEANDNSCGWVSYLDRWITARYGGDRVKIMNFGRGGISSGISALEDVSLKNDLPIRFNPWDLILIDFSTNDYFDHHQEVNKILEGIESFVRKYLLKYPTTPQILLEFHVFPDEYVQETYPFVHRPYMNPYRNISSHYKLPLWSYSDAFWNDFTSTNQKSTSNALHFAYNYDGDHIHPPWYSQLVYADLVGSLLLAHVDECRLHHIRDVVDNSSMLSIPTPLLELNTMYSSKCHSDANYSFVISGHKLMTQSNTGDTKLLSENNFSNSRFFMNSGWMYIVERNSKPGWISVNPQSSSIHSTIRYDLSDTESALVDYRDVTIQILYLHTYLNAGIVDVSVCGKFLGTIDALWSKHMSVSNAYFVRMCNYPSVCAHSGGRAYIELTHRPATEEDNRKHAFDIGIVNITESRGNEKFKIIKLHICAQSNHCFESRWKTNVFEPIRRRRV